MKTNLTNRIKADLRSPIPKWQAVFFLVAGLFFGTLFSVITPYSYRHIDRINADYAEGAVTSITYSYHRNNYFMETDRVSQILLDFSDLDRKFVRECVTPELVERVGQIVPGTRLTLYLRPGSSDVLGIEENGDVILDFDKSQAIIRKNTIGFFFLGIALYLLAFFGIRKL